MHLYPTDSLPLLLLAIGAVVTYLVARKSFAAASAGMRRFSLGVRLVVLALLALALMDIQARRTGDTRAVVVALDRSRSVPARLRDQAEAFARGVIPELGEKDRLGLVLFGETASLEYLPTAAPPTGAFQSVVKTDHTDLAAAVRLARAAFPEGAAKRILLVTDGNETRGDVRAEARAARADGVRIDVLPLAYRHEAEVAVERVTVPPKADEGETVEVRVTVSSTRETPATLYLREDGALVATERVQLRPGKNSFVVPRSLIPGFHTYEATVDPEADTIPANNRGFGFTHVHGEPRVLLVESQPELAQPLAAALEPHGIHLEVAGPSGLPASVGDLQNYDCLILSNVPATAFTPEQMKLVQGTVRDLGMGLIMIGGDQSFGQGGFQKTPIEEALPVDMEIRQKRVLPNGALVLIMHTCEIPEGNTWAREIAREAIRVLSPQDLVGLTYWGMGGYQWLFPLQPAADKKKLFRYLDGMSPGDMPDFDST
ncbi:MAG: VWA domain-containing protein, partial [Planctomycetales bacterium]|nr:VWA domain-containing protein [Planctomycetales bacterium]